jgi:hypothetical protein
MGLGSFGISGCGGENEGAAAVVQVVAVGCVGDLQTRRWRRGAAPAFDD